ncbi:MAG TPA: hypothetical protein VG389_14715, partial [Myxococcota bacterium]|nr:hypothetical protein [Myxococcota bacterium]
PFCVSGNCRCGDAGTTCDSDEACSASDATGNCTCGTDSNATGPACPDADEYETCYGTACGCTPSPSDSCTAGFVCDMTTHECECNGNGDCDPLNAITGENCNVSDLCDCGTITCGFGAVCATTSTCTCTNGSCED